MMTHPVLSANNHDKDLPPPHNDKAWQGEWFNGHSGLAHRLPLTAIWWELIDSQMTNKKLLAWAAALPGSEKAAPPYSLLTSMPMKIWLPSTSQYAINHPNKQPSLSHPWCNPTCHHPPSPHHHHHNNQLLTKRAITTTYTIVPYHWLLLITYWLCSSLDNTLEQTKWLMDEIVLLIPVLSNLASNTTLAHSHNKPNCNHLAYPTSCHNTSDPDH